MSENFEREEVEDDKKSQRSKVRKPKTNKKVQKNTLKKPNSPSPVSVVDKPVLVVDTLQVPVFPKLPVLSEEQKKGMRKAVLDRAREAWEKLSKNVQGPKVDIGEVPPEPPRRFSEVQGAYKSRITERKRSSIDPVIFAQIEDPKLRKILTENANLWERYGLRLSIDYPYKDGVVIINDKHIEITGIDKKTKQLKTKTLPFKVSLARATRDEALGVIEAVDKNVASVLPEEFFSVLYNESVSIAVVRDLKTQKGDQKPLETNGLDLLDSNETLMAVRSNPTRTLSENANKGDFDTAAYAVLHEIIHRWLHKYEKLDLKWPNTLVTIQDKTEFLTRRDRVANGEIGVRPQGFTDWQAAFSEDESDDQVATIANLIWNPKLEFEKAKSDLVLAKKIEISKIILSEVSEKLMDQDYWSFRVKGGNVQQYLESRRSTQLTKNK